MKAFLILCLVVLVPGSLAAAEQVDYVRDIQPILAKHCIACHGAKKQRSSLRLDSVRAAHLGGDSGPALVPGKSGASRLLQAVTGAKDVAAMPPKGPRLSADEIALLRAWIDSGAAIPPGEIAVQSERRSSEHWAFQPLRRRRSRPSRILTGVAIPSIASSSPGWKRRASHPPRRRIAPRCCAASRST